MKLTKFLETIKRLVELLHQHNVLRQATLWTWLNNKTDRSVGKSELSNLLQSWIENLPEDKEDDIEDINKNDFDEEFQDEEEYSDD